MAVTLRDHSARIDGGRPGNETVVDPSDFSQDAQDRSNPTSRRSNTFFCYRCGEDGHLSKQCSAAEDPNRVITKLIGSLNKARRPPNARSFQHVPSTVRRNTESNPTAQAWRVTALPAGRKVTSSKRHTACEATSDTENLRLIRLPGEHTRQARRRKAGERVPRTRQHLQRHGEERVPSGPSSEPSVPEEMSPSKHKVQLRDRLQTPARKRNMCARSPLPLRQTVTEARGESEPSDSTEDEDVLAHGDVQSCRSQAWGGALGPEFAFRERFSSRVYRQGP